MRGYRSSSEGFMAFGGDKAFGKSGKCCNGCPQCNSNKKPVSWLLIGLMFCISVGEIYYGWYNIDPVFKDRLAYHAPAAFDNASESTESLQELVTYISSRID